MAIRYFVQTLRMRQISWAATGFLVAEGWGLIFSLFGEKVFPPAETLAPLAGTALGLLN